MTNNNPLPRLVNHWYPELPIFPMGLPSSVCEIKSPHAPTTKKHLEKRLRNLRIPKNRFLITVTETSCYLSLWVADTYLPTVEHYLENI